MSTSGDFCFIDTKRVQSFFWALGPTMFWKKKDMAPKNTHKMTTGRIMRSKGMPAAFMESNSYRSPKFPNVINAASKMANGRDNGISASADKKKN